MTDTNVMTAAEQKELEKLRAPGARRKELEAKERHRQKIEALRGEAEYQTLRAQSKIDLCKQMVADLSTPEVRKLEGIPDDVLIRLGARALRDREGGEHPASIALPKLIARTRAAAQLQLARCEEELALAQKRLSDARGETEV